MNLNKVKQWDIVKPPEVKEINSRKKLVIFGLGDFAKVCEKALKKKNYNIYGFLVSKKTIESYNGTKVFDLQVATSIIILDKIYG